MPTTENLYIRPGDKYTARAVYRDEAGAVIDITGETVTMTIKADNFTDLVLGSGTGLNITPALGQIDITLTSTQTASLNGKTSKRYAIRLSIADKDILIGDIIEEPR